MRAKAIGPANTAMLPNTSSDVRLPSRNKKAPKALRLLHPVVFCVQLMKRSKIGAMATARLNRSGRTKFCTYSHRACPAQPCQKDRERQMKSHEAKPGSA